MRGVSGFKENEAGQMSLGTSGTGRPVSVLRLFSAATTMTTPNRRMSFLKSSAALFCTPGKALLTRREVPMTV